MLVLVAVVVVLLGWLPFRFPLTDVDRDMAVVTAGGVVGGGDGYEKHTSSHRNEDWIVWEQKKREGGWKKGDFSGSSDGEATTGCGQCSGADVVGVDGEAEK